MGDFVLFKHIYTKDSSFDSKNDGAVRQETGT